MGDLHIRDNHRDTQRRRESLGSLGKNNSPLAVQQLTDKDSWSHWDGLLLAVSICQV